jgi:hypothetical protein
MLIINLFIPAITQSNRAIEIKSTRVSFFLFSGLLAMVAFTGMIAMMLMEISFTLTIIIMVVALIILTALEIFRSRELHKLWMVSESGVSISWKFVLLEIVVVAIMVALMIMEKKGAISLS